MSLFRGITALGLKISGAVNSIKKKKCQGSLLKLSRLLKLPVFGGWGRELFFSPTVKGGGTPGVAQASCGRLWTEKSPRPHSWGDISLKGGACKQTRWRLECQGTWLWGSHGVKFFPCIRFPNSQEEVPEIGARPRRGFWGTTRWERNTGRPWGLGTKTGGKERRGTIKHGQGRGLRRNVGFAPSGGTLPSPTTGVGHGSFGGAVRSELSPAWGGLVEPRTHPQRAR